MNNDWLIVRGSQCTGRGCGFREMHYRHYGAKLGSRRGLPPPVAADRRNEQRD